MTQPSEHGQLTPQFCFNQTALRDFLRLSRATIDDAIIQNLNAHLHPSSPFDPTSTSSPRRPPSTRPSPTACQSFKETVLFPSWHARSTVLAYCASVATSPDPSDPDSLLRESEDEKMRERVVDERLDPYSGRYFPREPRTERLASLLRNERAVERIVRERSWRLLGERCGSGEEGWEGEVDLWRGKGR